MELQLKNDFQDILEKPDNYQIEVVAAGLESIKVLNNQVYEAKKILEKNILDRMESTESSKMAFIDTDGNAREITVSKGKMTADKALVDAYIKNGFDPEEIANLVHVPSRSKCKKAMKYGGKKKQIIEAYFKEGNKTLKVTK